MNSDKNNNRIEKIGNNNKSENIIDMDVLLNSLRKADARNLRMMRSFKWVFVVMMIIYSGIMVINPDPELKLHHRITGLCFVFAFALFYLVFRRYNTEFSNIDYSLPSSEMLKQAARRYEQNFSRYRNLLPSLLLADAGLTISEFYRWTSFSPLERILLIQAFYIPLLLISGLIGYFIWRRRYKPLLDGVRDLLKQLDEEY